MNHIRISLPYRAIFAALLVFGIAAALRAEPAPGVDSSDSDSARPPRREDSPSGPNRRPPPLALFDADRDGVISAAEIDAASDVLRRLDKNKDGELSGDELAPRRPPGGQGGPGNGNGGGGQRPPRDE